MLTLKILFWAMLLIVFYTYLGYGILLYLIIRLKRFFKGRRGKTAALKHGLRELKTRYVAFTDANTMINPDALREIARLFMDPTVGCVSGEKRVAARKEGEMAAEGEGLYWRYESTLKNGTASFIQRWVQQVSSMPSTPPLCARYPMRRCSTIS